MISPDVRALETKAYEAWARLGVLKSQGASVEAIAAARAAVGEAHVRAELAQLGLD